MRTPRSRRRVRDVVDMAPRKVSSAGGGPKLLRGFDARGRPRGDAGIGGPAPGSGANYGERVVTGRTFAKPTGDTCTTRWNGSRVFGCLLTGFVSRRRHVGSRPGGACHSSTEIDTTASGKQNDRARKMTRVG